MKKTIAAALILAVEILSATALPGSAAGTITVVPTSLSLAVCSAAGNTSGTISATQTGATISQTVSPPGIISLTPGSIANGGGTFTAQELKAGSATVTFASTVSGTKNQTATVTVTDPLVASPTSLSFSGNSQPAQSFTVTNPCGGTISSISYNTSAMTVTGCNSGTALSSTPVTCTVTPIGAVTNSAIAITDSFSGTATVTVNISSGSLTLNPASGSNLTTFVGNGSPIVASPSTDTFTAQETSYTGAFTPSVTTTVGTGPVVSVSPASTTGPGPATFTVTPVNYGKGSVKITDANGNSGTENVVVSGGTISISTSTVSWNNVTNNQQQFFGSSGGNVMVTGSLMTVNTGSQIAIDSPAFTNAAITGTHGGQMPIAALAYSCSGSVNKNSNQGASFSSQNLAFINGSLSQPCVSFSADTFSTINFNLSFFLDVRDLPADTYNANGFLVVLSAN